MSSCLGSKGRRSNGGWPAGKPSTCPRALWIIRQTAEALSALDRAGWMHGDVKPGNLMISPSGHVTLLDLNFARRHGESGAAVDRCILGTFYYIAPELLTSAIRADIRSDIYSLGVVFYEMLAGRRPFEAEDMADLAALHLHPLRRTSRSWPRTCPTA